jgi:methyltransferase (TIGR00027 family)
MQGLVPQSLTRDTAHMQANQPSKTAHGAAMHRAAHQLLDHPPVFADPLAIKIVGPEAAQTLKDGSGRQVLVEFAPLRAFIAVRSRFTEDCLGEAYANGVRQYAILGAGLDTFAYERSKIFSGLSVFEIDHPATQGWKKTMVREAGLNPPSSLTYAPVNFETETIRDGLARAGFDFEKPAWFAWLGVTPYLSREAISATLSLIASGKQGSGVAFDYSEGVRGDESSRGLRAMAERVAAIGEPFKSFFTPDESAALATRCGFKTVEDFDAAKLNARYFAGRSDGLRLYGRGHLIKASI